MLVALTRNISPALGRCELTHLHRAPIDVALAVRQHEAYRAALAALGCDVRTIAPAPELPDGVFVEDAALVLDEVAVIMRPGAVSRRPETVSVAEALGPLRTLATIDAPGTMDGGDLLPIGRTIHAGLSRRTNAAGLEQLGRIVAPHGYRVTGVPVEACLHLKSAATCVGDDLVLVNPAWVPPDAFRGTDRIAIDPAEPHAANALRIGDAVVHPAAFDRTRRRLEAAGLAVHPVDVTEIARAEGGVTCCSLVLEVRS